MATPAEFLAKFQGQFIALGLIVLAMTAILMLVFQITCKEKPANAYEHFESSEDAQLSAMKARTEKIRTIKETIQSDLDELANAADDTCIIMSQIEEVYVKNNSAPSDPQEFNLPQEMQKKFQDARRRRAILNFKEQQKSYVAVQGGKPLYECFYAEKEDVANAEQELATEVEELGRILDNAEIQSAVVKREKVYSLLGFAAKYLEAAMATTANTESDGQVRSAFIAAQKPIEYFTNGLSGANLLAKADEYIGKAMTFHEQIQKLKREVETAKKSSNQYYSVMAAASSATS